jgi:hypothetical protein
VRHAAAFALLFFLDTPTAGLIDDELESRAVGLSKADDALEKMRMGKLD